MLSYLMTPLAAALIKLSENRKLYLTAFIQALIQEDINTTAVVQMVELSDHFQEVLTEFS